MDYLVRIGAAIIPMIVGFAWYHSKTFGPAWMRSTGMTEEKANSGNMPLIFGLSFLMALLLTLPLEFFVNHPASALGGAESSNTFAHGMLHGGVLAVFVALPILGTKALFQQLSFKYVLINAGYWMVTFMLMGGLLDYWFPTVVYGS